MRGNLSLIRKTSGTHVYGLRVSVKEEICNERGFLPINPTVHELSLETLRQIIRKEAAIGGVLRNFARFTGKHLCQSQKETLAQVFSYEFSEIFKNIVFTDDYHCFCKDYKD